MYRIPPLIPYGSVRKTHGHRGEVVIDLAREELFDLDPKFLFVEIDGIPVPFQVESLRGDLSRLICCFTRVNGEEEANRLRGSRLLIPGDEKEETDDSESVPNVVGYTVRHPHIGTIGTVVDIDDTTTNILLLIQTADAGDEVMLPLVEEWITDIDEKKHIFTYDFPPSLLSL